MAPAAVLDRRGLRVRARGQLVAGTAALARSLAGAEPDAFVVHAPLYHLYGMLFDALLPALLGRPAYYTRTVGPLPRRHGRLLVVAVPSSWWRLDRSSTELARYERLVVAHSTGRLPATARHVHERQPGVGLFEVHGSTETGMVGLCEDERHNWTLAPDVSLTGPPVPGRQAGAAGGAQPPADPARRRCLPDGARPGNAALGAPPAQAGGRVVVLPPDDRDAGVLDRLDGLLLPGGADIDPAYFGQDRHPATDQPRQDRDAGELLLRTALERNLPVLGVCRGLNLREPSPARAPKANRPGDRHRTDDSGLMAPCREQGIAFIPFFAVSSPRREAAAGQEEDADRASQFRLSLFRSEGVVNRSTRQPC